MKTTRRQFVGTVAAGLTVTPTMLLAKLNSKPADSIATGLGITTSSLSGHLVAQPKKEQFSLPELPRIMRDELDMRVIDLNTSSVASYDPKYLYLCRNAAEKAGCVFINLKLNQRNLDMNSTDKAVREKAISEYKRSIDAAAQLGCKWARPWTPANLPDMQIHIDSYRELADYAAKHNMQMLVENFGWMDKDPESVPRLIKAIDRNVAVCPDTGNWANNEIRYAGLAKAFPLAVTCDFKAGAMGPQGEHELYDLKKCFEIGWECGFHGPWCFEHTNEDRTRLFRELGMLRDMLRKWIAEKA